MKVLKLAAGGGVEVADLGPTLAERHPKVRGYDGPRLMRVGGRPQITLSHFAGCEELPAEWYASALGWGSQLVATGADRAAVEAYCRDRFPGCVVSEG